MTKKDGPIFILIYAGSELLLADTTECWDIGGDSAIHYKNGVEAAITFLSRYDSAPDISEGDAEAFVNLHPYEVSIFLEQDSLC